MERLNYISNGVKRPDWLIIYLQKIVKELFCYLAPYILKIQMEQSFKYKSMKK